MKKKQIIIIIITLMGLLMLCGGILILLGKLKNNENNIDTSQDAPELEVETELQRVASKNVLLTKTLLQIIVQSLWQTSEGVNVDLSKI